MHNLLVRCFLLVAALVGAALLAPDAVLGDEGGSSLLEKLSAESADLAESGRRFVVRIEHERGTLAGVLVGNPGAQVVVALPPGATAEALPASGALRGEGVDTTARLLDFDADLGLAIYAPATELLGLSTSSPASARRRGALALLADAEPPALLALPATGAELDDLVLPDAGPGGLLLAPGGALLGVAHGSLADPAELSSCAACHEAGSVSRVAADRLLIGAARPREVALQRLLTDQAVLGSADGGKTWHRGLVGAQTRGARFVPAAVVARALEDVKATRRLAAPYLGVILDEPARLALAHVRPQEQWLHSWTAPEGAAPRSVRVLYGVPGIAAEPGVRVARVVAGSPAAQAGLQAGAVLLAIDGAPIADAAQFVQRLARRRPGESLTLAVKGSDAALTVVLGDRRAAAAALASASSVGLDGQTLDAALAAYLRLEGVTADHGVVVRVATPGSAAETAGLQRGDVIVSVAGSPVRDVGELDAVLGSTPGPVRLEVLRGGQRLTVEVKPTTGSSAPKAR
jgi:S1-C subfamily serine protease